MCLEEHDKEIIRLEDYFEIREILGKGGFGLVVEAWDRAKNEVVALKIVERVKGEVEF